MALNVFTIDDRRKLQHYLNLPIQEVREGSYLWSALSYVETIDESEGTTIAADIQSRLKTLDCLESVDGSQGNWIEAIQSSSSFAKSINIPDQFSETYANPTSGSGYTGEAASLESYKKYLISSIRRDLALSQQTGNNSLNTAWPGGRSEPSRVGLYNRGRGLV